MTKNGQVSLFEDKNTSWEIKKHSSIVQMSNVTTLVERKSMNALIRIAKDCLKRDDAFAARSYAPDTSRPWALH